MPQAEVRPVQIEQLEKSLGRQRGPTVDASLGRSQPGPGFAPKSNSSGSNSIGSTVSTDSAQSNTDSNSGDAPRQPGTADVISGIQQGKPWDTKCPNLLIKGVHRMF
jgi:hypothetical protein